jgi:tRNA (adenine57-N1/adenine58-N1)-methyltransferase
VERARGPGARLERSTCGQIAVESGTGSGSMTHSMARLVGPSGHVYSFDFHAPRVAQAQEEVSRHGMARHVTVACADVYAAGFALPAGVWADGVLLDLPNPWLAVAHAREALKERGRLCSFSPCVEQVSKTCDALRAHGFTDVTTIECLVRHHEINKVAQDVPRCDRTAAPRLQRRWSD